MSNTKCSHYNYSFGFDENVRTAHVFSEHLFWSPISLRKPLANMCMICTKPCLSEAQIEVLEGLVRLGAGPEIIEKTMSQFGFKKINV